jgi:hypothetical protein
LIEATHSSFRAVPPVVAKHDHGVTDGVHKGNNEESIQQRKGSLHPSAPAGLKGETEDAGKGAAVGTAPLFPDMLRSHLRHHPLVRLLSHDMLCAACCRITCFLFHARASSMSKDAGAFITSSVALYTLLLRKHANIGSRSHAMESQRNTQAKLYTEGNKTSIEI